MLARTLLSHVRESQVVWSDGQVATPRKIAVATHDAQVRTWDAVMQT